MLRFDERRVYTNEIRRRNEASVRSYRLIPPSLGRAGRFMNPPSSRGIGWTSSLETIVRLIVWIDRRRSISIIKYFGKLAHFDVGSKRSDFPEARDTWVGFEPR